MATSIRPELIVQIRQALSTVYDPDLRKDLISLNMIQDLQVSPTGVVQFRVVLTTPACPLKAKLEQDCRHAVEGLEGVTQVIIKMDAQVHRKVSQPLASGCKPIPGVAHLIAVSSGKGGVGKSTVSANLAVALAKTGASVGLLDADVYGPNIPTLMGVTQLPTFENELFQPPVAHGVKVMSMGFLIKDDQPLVWRGPMLHSVVQQFCYQVNWGTLDYLVVDLPPGTGDVQLSLSQLVPISGVVMVSTAQEVAMQDVRKAFHMFAQVRVPILGVVENMSYFVCNQCQAQHFIFSSPGSLSGGQRLAQKFHTELLAQIPLMPEIVKLGDLGHPIALNSGNQDLAPEQRTELFDQLAGKVAQKIAILSSQEAAHPSLEIGVFS